MDNQLDHWDILRRLRRRGAHYLTNGLLASIVAFGSIAAQPAIFTRAAESEPPINLSIDKDKDGVSDELAAALQPALTAATDDERVGILKDVLARLPYSDETRALQDQAGQLEQKLEATQDPAEAEALTKEIRTIGDAMIKDPGYAQTKESLDALFKPAELKNDAPHLLSVPWNLAKQGDILLQVDLTSPMTYLYAMNYGHTGNCFDQSCSTIFESLPNGVVLTARDSAGSPWRGWGKFVAIKRDSQVAQSTIVQNMQARKVKHIDQTHTPYNFFLPDKWTDTRLYCSQLTWKIHNDAGVDLDSNHPSYFLYIYFRWGLPIALLTGPAVAPDEINLSPKAFLVGSGWA